MLDGGWWMYLGGHFSPQCPMLYVGVNGFGSQISLQDLKKTIHI